MSMPWILGLPLVVLSGAVGWLLSRRFRAAPRTAPPPLERLVDRLDGLAFQCREDRSFEYVSGGALELTGFSPEELTRPPLSLSDLVHPADRVGVARELAAAALEGRQVDFTYRILHRSGEPRWVREQGATLPASPLIRGGFEGFLTDVTERQQASERQLRESLRDSLTGLATRTLFVERLAMAIRRSHRRHQPSFAVLFFDLDKFQKINESLGRQVGDRVLVATARRLEACVRQEDTVARVGGDEFAILLEELADASDAVRVAHRLTEVAALPLYLGDDDIFVTASVGIATGVSGYREEGDALRDAEIAMGRAKANGQGSHQIFDPGMHQRAVAQLRMETDLRRALARQEFRLCYQPIFSLSDGRLRGFEALLRWHRRDRIVMPDEFLNTALEIGLIVPISWWVLSEACRQLLYWQRRGPEHRSLFVCVNLTAQQLALPDLVDRVRSALLASSISAQSLRIEITESVVMENLDSIVVTLAALKELGVQISLDDFGTGYSSLSSLSQLPLGSLKVDRGFIHSLSAKSTSHEIVRAIVALAHALGLEVVGEGVERQEQADILAELGCDDAQGFLYGQPLEASAALALLDELETTQLRRWA